MNILQDTEDWVSLLAQSEHTPVILFKHSSDCETSARVKKDIDNLEEEYGDSLYMVIVQDSRDISNAIADILSVEHETPQILVIYKRKSVYDESHSDIRHEKVKDVIESL